MRRLFRKLLIPPMVVAATLILLWEEWLWVHLEAVMAWVARAPLLRRLESGIAKLPPYPAMGVFLLPSLMLLPVNLCGVWLTAHGHAAAGTGLLIAAKLVGTAVVARLFSLCRDSLLTLGWFRRLYEALMRLRTRLYQSAPWQAAVRWKSRVRERLAAMLKPWRGGNLRRRWQAVRASLRRRARD